MIKICHSLVSQSINALPVLDFEKLPTEATTSKPNLFHSSVTQSNQTYDGNGTS